MSSAAAFVPRPSSAAHLRKSKKGVSFRHHYKTHFIGTGALKPAPPSSLLFIRKSSDGYKKNPNFNPRRPFSPVMEWQDCRAEIEVDVPASVAYDYYSDRERIPEWMPFISSVKVLKDKPDLSRWSLKYEAFGRDIEFAWLARNMQPIRNQKIHWRSMEGLPNKGAVRFFPTGPSSCRVEVRDIRYLVYSLFTSYNIFKKLVLMNFIFLSPYDMQLTTSYEVPDILIPVAAAVKPLTEGLLQLGLKRFATLVKNYRKEAPRT